MPARDPSWTISLRYSSWRWHYSGAHQLRVPGQRAQLRQEAVPGGGGDRFVRYGLVFLGIIQFLVGIAVMIEVRDGPRSGG